MSSILRKTVKIVQSVALAAMLVFLLLVGLSFLPIKGNVKIFTVQSGSMEPSIKTGSVIFVWPSKTYEIGDVVTRNTKNSQTTVTHRIIEKNSDQFVTKGDANNMADPEPFVASSIVGKVMLKIPNLGYPIGFARSAKGFLLLIIIPSLFVVFDEALNIKNEISSMRKKNKASKNEILKRSLQKDPVLVKINRIETKCMPKDIRRICL